MFKSLPSSQCFCSVHFHDNTMYKCSSFEMQTVQASFLSFKSNFACFSLFSQFVTLFLVIMDPW